MTTPRPAKTPPFVLPDVSLTNRPITADTGPVVRDVLARAPDAVHACYLIIDLSAVTYLEADGLSTLLEARHRYRTRGGPRLAIVRNPQSTAIPGLYLVSLWPA
ncbi:MAG: STAS domain-containing protein, partial [Pseudonocardiales bacterium]|nr:STAS domain-containing protein [Pseudonocardiales bacterium]